MKAPPLVAAPLVRGRRNRPIDSRIYLEGGMIQPGRLPRSLPPPTRDARDPREDPREDPPFAIDRLPALLSPALGDQAL